MREGERETEPGGEREKGGTTHSRLGPREGGAGLGERSVPATPSSTGRRNLTSPVSRQDPTCEAECEGGRERESPASARARERVAQF